MRKLLLLLLCFSSFLLTPHFASAQENSLEQYRPLLLKNAERLGITATDATDAVITQAYTDPTSHVTFIYLQQAYQQIKVYNTIISAAFIEGSLQYASGTFVKDIASKAGASASARSAQTSYMDAAHGAIRHLHLKESAPVALSKDLFTTEKKYTLSADAIARKPIETTLYWTPSEDKKQVTLTWNVNIHVKEGADWWNVRLNAQTGEVVQQDNWAVNEKLPESALTINTLNSIPAEDNSPVIINSNNNVLRAAPRQVLAPPNVASATYRVVPFPYESPIHSSFSDEVNPWLKAGATNNAVTLGWHFDSTSNYTITRGNNVFAFLDRRANNTAEPLRNWPDTSLTPAPDLTFLHNINTSQQPWLNTESKKAALDNLFYWNNLMHDVTYQYGFTEAAGNFQRNNLGRGGTGNDHVLAQAQDSAGYSNANFATPTDGASGVMQMYTWATSPNFNITAPSTIAGSYTSIESSFSSPNKLVDRGPITGRIVWYNDDSAGTIHRGCAAATNAAAVAGNIAMIDAYGGTGCTTYAYKVKNAQNAGAIAVIIYFPTNSIGGIGGTDATITVPTIVIPKSTGDLIAAQLAASQVVNATIASGLYIDGDLDNGIICHEYGHGISNRLTGGAFGASCLYNAEQGGEGWSDYMSLMMTTNWATAQVTDGPNRRTVGTYAAGQTTLGSGIRSYPYSTNLSINPHTYADLATNTESHAIGEVWCTTLWDMTWNIIQQQNAITPDLYNSAGTGGNAIAMNLVMTGMKLQPCTPGFLDARDAILAADSILYGYSHKCAIWNAFARRGMGYSASQGSPFSATDQIVAYNLPPGIIITKASPLSVPATTNYTFTRTATCNCQPATFTFRDTIPAGFTYVSSTPSGTLTGNVLTFPATAFASGEAKTFSLTLKAPVTGCTIDTVINDNRDSSTVGGLVSSGTSAWTPSAVRAYSGTNSWFAPNRTTTSTTSLTSASTSTSPGKPLSILSFWHNFRTETTYDGGVVEYSTNGGASWTDASPLFLNNGYTYPMDASTTLAGRKSFNGNSKGFEQTLVNLSSLDTLPVQFRFRMETDAGLGVEGWYLDDIVRANGCGEILRSGIYDTVGRRWDSASVPVFVTLKPVPPFTLLSFNANQFLTGVKLDWETAAEGKVATYGIEWSVDTVTWRTLSTVNAKHQDTSDYDFFHWNPISGTNYYRLKINDTLGSYTYSPVKAVKLKGRLTPGIVLVPNPVKTDAVLYIADDVKATNVKIYDIWGRVVRQITVNPGQQTVAISTSGLSNGIYTIIVTGASREITIMLVQH